MMSRGEFGIFLNRPISVAMLAVAVLLLTVHLVTELRRAHARRSEKLAEGVPVERPASL